MMMTMYIFRSFSPKLSLFYLFRPLRKNNLSVTRKIQRSVLIAHIKSLAVESIKENEAFITSIMAKQVVELIHFFNHRTAISPEVGSE